MPLAVIPAGYGRAQSDARYLRKNALQNSAADFAQFGAAPSAAAAVNIDAASFANLAMDIRNGAAIVQLVNDGTQPYLGTTSAHAFDFLANGERKWGILADASGTATLISRQPTARMVGGSLNGWALRNAINTADLLSVSATGALVVTGSATIQTIPFGLGGSAMTRNLALGGGALTANTTGNDDLALGVNALLANLSGSNLLALGTNALATNTLGSNLLGLGVNALTANLSGNNSLGVGVNALATNSTGSALIGLGFSAGRYETLSNALYINSIDRLNTAGDKALSIIYGVQAATAAAQTLALNASVTVSQTLRLGNFLVASLPGAAITGIGANSFVTDSVATIITGLGLTVTGGGTNKVPVYSDGVNWIIG